MCVRKQRITMPQKPNIRPFPAWLNYDFLRRSGLDHIGQLSGKLWTDHNSHDPGITIMEVLCYALTDLGYRNQFPNEDLFARPLSALSDSDSNFFSPSEILSVNPLTLNDYQKLLLDISGVRNAWLEKRVEKDGSAEVPIYVKQDANTLTFNKTNKELIVNGLYNVFIDLEENTPQSGSLANKQLTDGEIWKKVHDVLHRHRNLCEDFFNIQIIDTQIIGLCMELDLDANAIPEDVLVEIFDEIQKFLTPAVPFYTLQDLLEKDKPIDEIFQGRPMEFNPTSPESHGFILTEDLAQLASKDKLHVSDLYKIIMNLPNGGVRAIRRLIVKDVNGNKSDEWCLTLDPHKSPRLSVKDSDVFYFKGQLPVKFDKDSVDQKLNQRLANYFKTRRSPYELGLQVSQGIYRDFADYTSIQEEFPVVYNVGRGHLSTDKTPRHFQALQLKGYLTFFDQILANYLAQLSNVRELFAIRSNKISEATYFNAPLTSMPDVELVLRHWQNETDQLESLNINSGINGGGNIYSGQSLARIDGDLNTLSEREATIYFFQKAFNENRIEIKVFDRWETESPRIEERDRFNYSLKINSHNAIVKCLYNFRTEKDARQHAELVSNLAASPEGYRRIDRANAFGFEIIFNPLDYRAYLNRIAETSDKFYQRRDLILNHLLARFAEQFTEYTLLMYALNGKANEQDEIVADKARFLSQYDETSRNRGKGFNYIDAQNIWDTKNISGLEKRVAGFMGLDDIRRQTLNHFKIVNSEKTVQLTWTDPLSKQAVWQIGNLTETAAATIQADFITKAFKKGAVIEPVNDAADSIFTFKFRDPQTGFTIWHPQQYATADARDAVMNFFKTYYRYFKAGVSAGYVVQTEVKDTQYRFVLRDKEENIILQSTTTFDTEGEAELAFVQNQIFAYNEQNYEALPDKFVLKNGKGDVIAESVMPVENEGESGAAMLAFSEWWRASILPLELMEAYTYIRWQVRDASGKLLIFSTLRFQSSDESHAITALWEALQIMKRDNAWRVVQDEDTEHYFIGLFKIDSPKRLYLPWEMPENAILIGRAVGDYTSVEAAEAASIVLQNQLKDAVRLHDLIFSEPIPEEAKKKPSKNQNTPERVHQWGFRLLLPEENYPQMVSSLRYETPIEATLAFLALLKKAKNITNYTPIDKTDYYRFSIESKAGETPQLSVTSFDSYASETLRNDAIKHIAEVLSRSEVAFQVFDSSEKSFFLQIPALGGHADEPLAVSSDRFNTEGAALETIKSRLAQGKSIWQPIEEALTDGGKRYGFALVSTPIVAASDSEIPQEAVIDSKDFVMQSYNWYLKAEDRDEQIKQLNKRIVPTNTVSKEQTYRLIFNYWACNLTIQPLFVGEIDFQDEPSALDAANMYVANLQHHSLHLFDEKASPKKGRVNWRAGISDTVVAKTVDDFLIENIIDSIFNFYKKPFALSSQTDDIPQRRDYPALPDAPGDRYRLRNESYVLATYRKVFGSKLEQEQAFQSFFDYWQKATHLFTDLYKIGTDRLDIKGSNTVFRFVLRYGHDEITLRTLKLYSDTKYAIEENEPQLLDYVEILRGQDRYDILARGDYFVVQIIGLHKDKNGNPENILEVATLFDSEKGALKCANTIRAWAQLYPIFKNAKGEIHFRLWNSATETYDWLSVEPYEGIRAACIAFEEMIRLLQNSANVLFTSTPYTLLLGEVLLESKESYVFDEKEDENCKNLYCNSSEKTWAIGVDWLLDNVFHDDRRFIKMDSPCQYGYVVGGKDYHVAIHPVWYDTPEARTAAYQSIFNKINCGAAPQYVNLPDFNIEIKKIEDQEFYIYKAKLESDNITVEWHIIRLEKIEDSENPFNLWYSILIEMEETVFYSIEKRPDGTTFSLRLLNEDSLEIAHTHTVFANYADAEAARDWTIQRARQHPTKVARGTRNGEESQYFFKIYNPDSQQYIWSGVGRFKTPKDVQTQLNQYSAIVQNRDAFLMTRQPSKVGFGFSLVDNKNLIACSANTFGSYEAAQQGMERMLKLVDTEGMHLMEHILLRPKRNGAELLPLSLPLFELSKNANLSQYKDCLDFLNVGGDPYSSQITILLPYWVKRFQSDRFRDFFENTLRRELPAHCELNLIWLAPHDLLKFETAYRAWLTKLTTGEAYVEQDNLIKILKGLNSFYVGGTLAGDSIGDDTGYYYDEVTLR